MLQPYHVYVAKLRLQLDQLSAEGLRADIKKLKVDFQELFFLAKHMKQAAPEEASELITNLLESYKGVRRPLKKLDRVLSLNNQRIARLREVSFSLPLQAMSCYLSMAKNLTMI